LYVQRFISGKLAVDDKGSLNCLVNCELTALYWIQGIQKFKLGNSSGGLHVLSGRGRVLLLVLLKIDLGRLLLSPT
jgi:hypothetical protein